MITKKYDYKALKRVNIDGKRHYTLGGTNYGHMVSVTTILSATKPEADKQMLDNWRERIGHQQADEITMEAANRGTRLHNYLELYLESETNQLPAPGSNPFAKHANDMARLVIKKGLCNVSEVWGTEVPVCYPKIYAGTTDCVGIHNTDESIIDFKQSNWPKKEEWIQDYFIQLTLYGIAHNKLFNTNIKKGVIMICTKDLEFQEFVLEGKVWAKTVGLMWKRLEAYYLSMVQ